MNTSRLTKRGRIAVPQPVRVRLGLRAGDVLAFSFEGDKLVLSRAEPGASHSAFATFSEWAG